MKPGRIVPLALCLLTAACSREPEPYAPPVQRRPRLGPDTSRLKHFVAMNDPDAPAHILRDIGGLEGNSFRWTNQRPLLRFVLPVTKGLRLVADFGFHPDTLRDTGPVTITFLVNGHRLDQRVYATSGEHRFEKPVPADWLYVGDNVVALELDKIWKGHDGSAALGVTLLRAGFTQ